jgi:effector-binding domain-containing protein
VSYEIELVERDARHVACVRVPVPEGEIGDLVGRLIMEVWGELEAAGVHPAGPPYARSTWQPGTELEVGFPVQETFAGEGRVVAGELPGGRAVTLTHVGPYDQLAGAFAAMQSWAVERGLQPGGVPWEVYQSDPRETPDPQDWRTELVLPVQ